MKRLGLIINPIAGMGGRVGLKGTDGAETLAAAIKKGACPEAGIKTGLALKPLLPLRGKLEVYTCPAAMGEDVARQAGFQPTIVGEGGPKSTTPADTRKGARAMVDRGVDLLLFAGGDGTARDIYSSVGTEIVTLGIPAGVKIHSGVFATSPQSAGRLAAFYLTGAIDEVQEMEVMDIDEDAFRAGRVTARLFGYLRIPFAGQMVQGMKSGQNPDSNAVQGIAQRIVDDMKDSVYYIIGPGTTTRAVMEELGLAYTLLGVDVVKDKHLIARDTGEEELLSITDKGPCKIVVTIIGGQGYIFGRGNQQLSARVIKKVGRESIIVVAGKEKLRALAPRPLLVDTGDADLDELLAGYMKVRTGYNTEAVHLVVPA